MLRQGPGLVSLFPFDISKLIHGSAFKINTIYEAGLTLSAVESERQMAENSNLAFNHKA